MTKKKKVSKVGKKNLKSPQHIRSPGLSTVTQLGEDTHGPDNEPYVRPEAIIVEGATAPTGVPWILTKDPSTNRQAWIPFRDFTDDARAARAKLTNSQILLFGEAVKTWIAKVRKVEQFPPRPLIENIGWTGHNFALASGEVFSPAAEADQVVLFETDPNKCSTKGTLKDWKTGIARLAGDQDIITFTLMLAFAGALLRFSCVDTNLGFELVGPKAVGKSTGQRLVSTVHGGAIEPHGRNFWISANTTMNGLEDILPQHADGMIVIEEMSLFCAGDANRIRAAKLMDLVFRLESGTIKKRHQSDTSQHVRFVYLTSSNEPLARVLGSDLSQKEDAAIDRLLTIPIPSDAKHGIFTTLPVGCVTGDQAARAIRDLTETNYGFAIRRFLGQLAQELSADEDGVKARIDRYIAKFRAAVGVDGDAGSAVRVAKAFGLVYAAGRFAKRYGALPKELRCLHAARECHRLNRETNSPPPSMLDQLQVLSKRSGVIVVEPASLRKISDQELREAPALLRKLSKRRTELLLTKAALKREFPQRRALLADKAVMALSIRDKDRPTCKRTVRTNKKQERFYCFELS